MGLEIALLALALPAVLGLLLPAGNGRRLLVALILIFTGRCFDWRIEQLPFDTFFTSGAGWWMAAVQVVELLAILEYLQFLVTISWLTDRRGQADRSGAKTGNINHAPTIIQGDLNLLLDAGFLPYKTAFGGWQVILTTLRSSLMGRLRISITPMPSSTTPISVAAENVNKLSSLKSSCRGALPWADFPPHRSLKTSCSPFPL